VLPSWQKKGFQRMGRRKPIKKKAVQMNKSNVIPFTFDGNVTVRVIDVDGESWFVLADVCAVLAIGNPSNVAAKLDDEEKNTLHIMEGNRGNPNVTIINESGLYSLILTSRKEQAKRFKKWITSEVIPSIRKTGKYEAPKAVRYDDEPAAVETPDSVKLKKVNTAARCFGERAGAQLWHKLGLEWVPAMGAVVNQADLFDEAEIVVKLKKNG
jgi:prophage antirepressor-like protein